jgi:hypothetical protein
LYFLFHKKTGRVERWLHWPQKRATETKQGAKVIKCGLFLGCWGDCFSTGCG